MHEVLTDIVERTREYVVAAKRLRPLDDSVGARMPKARPFLRRPDASATVIIAEIKVASPTHPRLGSLDEAATRAAAYEAAGAGAISFITEKHYFKGDQAYIARIKEATSLPVLQKDFIVDEYQIYEAALAGADALLLIARLVEGPVLERFAELAQRLGLEPVVEVHDAADLAKAVATSARIIAVNARDLATFEVDVTGACQLLKQVPARFVRLGFSGVVSGSEAREYQAAGADGILVGTSLMQAPDIDAFMREMKRQ